MTHAAEPQHGQTLPITDPTPIGLICLAIGCAALVPIAFPGPVFRPRSST